MRNWCVPPTGERLVLIGEFCAVHHFALIADNIDHLPEPDKLSGSPLQRDTFGLPPVRPCVGHER